MRIRVAVFILPFLCLLCFPCWAKEADSHVISENIDLKQKQLLFSDKFRTITSPGNLPDPVKKYYAGTRSIESILTPNYKKWRRGPCGFGQEGRAASRFVTAACSSHQCAVLYQSWYWPCVHWDLFDVTGSEAKLVSDSRLYDVSLCASGTELVRTIRYQCSHPLKSNPKSCLNLHHRTSPKNSQTTALLGFDPDTLPPAPSRKNKP